MWLAKVMAGLAALSQAPTTGIPSGWGPTGGTLPPAVGDREGETVPEAAPPVPERVAAHLEVAAVFAIACSWICRCHRYRSTTWALLVPLFLPGSRAWLVTTHGTVTEDPVSFMLDFAGTTVLTVRTGLIILLLIGSLVCHMMPAPGGTGPSRTESINYRFLLLGHLRMTTTTASEHS